MAFWDDAKKKMMQAMKPRQQQERQGFSSNRADGGFSGYVPKMKKPDAEQGQNSLRQGAVGYAHMMPDGVDPNMVQQLQPVGGQTGAVPPQQAMPQQGMPQQGMPQQPPFGRHGYQQQPMGAPQQPMGGQIPPRPQAQFQGQPFQQPMQQTQRGFTVRQQAQPQGGFQQGNMPPQPNPAPNEPQTFAFPGGDSYMVDGNAYKMILRVAQITGVPSCFRVIEFMYNNEAVIVNAEQVTDLVEADRCMDLIFGAACAMKQRLMRVSGKQIYVIAPPQVYVAPFESLRRAGMADIERRWPGAMHAGAQPQPPMNNVQPMQPMYQQPRQEDFVGGFGRRAARNAMHNNGYTDYGGFNTKSR